MRLSSAGLWLGIFVVVVGCSSMGCSSADESAPFVPDAGVPGVDASIDFEHDGTLTLAPSELADISVVGKPPAPYAMTFLLVGDALDASLDRTTAVAGSDGRVTVKLKAPNAAATFRVRATIKSGPSAELQVAVSDQGFATVVVVPEATSQRPVLDGWEARVVSGTSCEALGPTFPDDPPGSLAASAAPDENPIIDSAPVGPNLTVFLRAGHYMWGCSDEPDLVAGETKEVHVQVIPKPLDATQAELDLALGVVPEEQPWQALLSSHLALMIDAFFAPAQGDPPQALLLAMQAQAADPSAFAAASQQNAWYDAVQQHLGLNAVDIAQSITDFAASGLGSQLPEIGGVVRSIGSTPGFAVFTLDHFGTVDTAALSVPADYVMTLTVDADDTARLGGTLFWLPSRYIGESVETAALQQFPNSGTFAAALADIVKCDQLDLQGLPSCPQSCIAQLCRQAVATRWLAAIDASASASLWGEITLQASGGSSFDDEAALTGFVGSWLGNATDGILDAKITGTAIAERLGPPAQ
jgi:hypothetical protein